MNNYVLNNTSVYLGGQCGWDVVLSKNDDELYVSEFQLAPLAYNVPFNKKAHSYSVNNVHSDNLKNFYNDIKENFWWTTPNIDKYSKLDATYMRGLSRLPEYSVYDKQFRFLVPLWLENVNNVLKFNITLYTVNLDGTRGEQLNSKVLELNIKDGLVFHNKFVKYFNEWLTYLNILPNPERYKTEDNANEGNNKVLKIDLKERKAAIDGIYISTGQRSGEVNVDYITDNLLSIERPNMETDYLLSSLFVTHGVIASQLFNICLCFNPVDILDSFIINQMKGCRLCADCDVYIGDIKLETRNIFTNYEKIEETVLNPFFIIDDNTIVDPINEDIITDYNLYVRISGDDSDYVDLNEYIDNSNVLNYLKDYNDKNLKYINKLNQHTFHWGYIGDNDKTFNLYNGYKCSYIDFGSSLSKFPQVGKTIYKSTLYDVNASNGLTIIDFPNSYSPGNNPFMWLSPGSILYAEGTGIQLKQLLNNLTMDIAGLIGYDNKKQNIMFSIPRCKSMWGDTLLSTDPDTKLLCMYVHDTNKTLYEEYISTYNQGRRCLMCPGGSGEILYNEKRDNYIIIVKSDSSQYDTQYYFVLTDSLEYLVLNNLIDIVERNKDNEIYESLCKFYDYLVESKNIIINSNEGEYYGFGYDLGIFEDSLLRQTYYKLDSQTSYVYRESGCLIPLFSNSYKNFKYFYNDSTTEIIKGELNDQKLGITDIKYIPETKWLDNDSNGWNLLLINQISFTIIGSEIDKTLNDVIKQRLIKYYDLNSHSSDNSETYDLDTIINYIYNLYDKDIHFEYASDNDISKEHVIYTVKLTLR